MGAKLPDLKIPKREKWREIRANAKGKKGLSKHNLGQGIQDFHAAYQKAKDKDDAVGAQMVVATLDMLCDKYCNDIKVKYPDLAKAVTNNLITPLSTLEKELKKIQKEKEEGQKNQVKQQNEKFLVASELVRKVGVAVNVEAAKYHKTKMILDNTVEKNRVPTDQRDKTVLSSKADCTKSIEVITGLKKQLDPIMNSDPKFSTEEFKAMGLAELAHKIANIVGAIKHLGEILK
jgi:hypothetical protein